jgi:hypothetical protein
MVTTLLKPARAMKMHAIRALMVRMQLVATLSLVMLWLGALRILVQDSPNFP